MIAGRIRILIVWLVCLLAALAVVIRAHYITDLSAFLPRNPTPSQRLLVDQLRDGPAARLILIAIEGGSADSRAKVSLAMAAALKRDLQFAAINNGEAESEQSSREFLFKHRYLLSDQVNTARFSAVGLHDAISDTIGDLASPSGILFKSLLPRDPTGELLHIVDQLAAGAAPETRDGVWVAAGGSRALAVAQTAALGSDTDAQQRAITAIRTAFEAAVKQSQAAGVVLRLSGPGVFAVAARAKIEHAAVRLSLLSSLIVVTLLLAVYRSVTVLALGLLPVATAAIVGVAAVALGFGAVHGITLGFGITLIGESVDYSIYFFLQSGSGRDRDAGVWKQRWWPTVRLGMLTSVCGFASLLPSGFPGLQQLGLYSICGLIAAALVTRFVLPALKQSALAIRDVAPIGAAVARILPAVNGRAQKPWIIAGLIAAAAFSVLLVRHASLWNRELSALSPISVDEQNFDATLRGDLGAADVRDLVVISGADLEAVLQGSERAVTALQALVNTRIIGSIDAPTNYLPSTATQEARRGSLPGGAQLRENLRQAAAGLAVRYERLQPFLEDVESARHGPLLSARDLSGTAMNAGFESMILHQPQRWNALLPLHSAHAGEEIDLRKVAQALDEADIPEARVLDLKRESDSLYAQYLGEAIRLSLAGFAALTILLLIALRSPARVARVLAPLVLAVLIVAAGLCLCGVQYTILHLVGMLLIVAVGSNYALFFDRQAHAQEPQAASLTLASLLVANASTVVGFGLLSFSQVPVLVTLGTTVAPGTFLALLAAALLSSRHA
jgi:predicted exporter